MRKTRRQQLVDLAFAPLRLAVFPDDTSTRLGLTSLEDERIGAVLPYVRGRLLDVGCGRNRLVREYGDGIGVDVHPWAEDVVVVDNSARLPFPNESFDTVSFLACLNHIPEREAALEEAHRLLRSGGRVIVTMIDPLIGWIGHRIWWYSEDKHRDVHPGERDGLWPEEVGRMLHAARFDIVTRKRFVYGLNGLTIAEKRTAAEASGE